MPDLLTFRPDVNILRAESSIPFGTLGFGERCLLKEKKNMRVIINYIFLNFSYTDHIYVLRNSSHIFTKILCQFVVAIS